MSTTRTPTVGAKQDAAHEFVWVGQAFLLAVGYYLLGRLGLVLETHEYRGSHFWPAIGLAVGVVYQVGYRLLPGVWLGSFAVNVGIVGPLTSAGIGVGTTIATGIVVWLLRRYRLSSGFGSSRDLRVLLLASSVGAAASALVSPIWTLLVGNLPSHKLAGSVLGWFLGDYVGIVLVAPLILTWSSKWLPKLRRRANQRELFLVTIGTVGIGVLLFSGLLPNGSWSLPMTFLPIVCVGWAAAVGRAWPALVQAVILTIFVIFAHTRGIGPGAYVDPGVRSYAMWAYIMTLGIIALGLSALLTERDEVVRQLTASEGQYRAIIHDNPALICQFKVDGTLLVVNETFRTSFQGKTTGVWETRLDLRKKSQPVRNFYEISGVAENPETLKMIRTHDDPMRPIFFETCTRGPLDEVQWFRWTARAVDVSSTAITEYHAVGLDVTEQKRVEAERARLEAQAIQTQQYEAIGVLAGGIAHEFNNILTSVIGYADFCTTELKADHTLQPMMKQILTGAQRAADLTKQLMIYGGQSHTYPRPVDLTRLVEESKTLVEVAVPKRYQIRYELATDRVEAFADDGKLRRLLMNLVTNASESLAGRPRTEILIHTNCVDVAEKSPYRSWTNGANLKPGKYVQLTIRDTGCGMDQDILGRIFQPFFTTKFPGRGLGLAAVLGIVQDHHGAIQVESRPHKGTTVRVILPSNWVLDEVDTPSPIPVGSRRSEVVPNRSIARW